MPELPTKSHCALENAYVNLQSRKPDCHLKSKRIQLLKTVYLAKTDYGQQPPTQLKTCLREGRVFWNLLVPPTHKKEKKANKHFAV